jgi:hypothetical protein
VSQSPQAGSHLSSGRSVDVIIIGVREPPHKKKGHGD